MIQTLAHATAGGFALASPAERPHPQPIRIAALSTAIALNLLLFGLVMVPISLPPPAALTAPPRITLRIIPKTPPIMTAPIRSDPIKPRPAPVVRDIVTPPRVATPTYTTSSNALSNAEVTTPIDDTATGSGPVTDFGSGIESTPVQLAYRSAPPPAYPRNAMRRGLGGTVLLRILVDVDGQPLHVMIERSSGYRELDDAAREQVLARWLFQPAVRNGTAVQAYGLVPITFAPQR